MEIQFLKLSLRTLATTRKKWNVLTNSGKEKWQKSLLKKHWWNVGWIQAGEERENIIIQRNRNRAKTVWPKTYSGSWEPTPGLWQLTGRGAISVTFGECGRLTGLYLYSSWPAVSTNTKLMAGSKLTSGAWIQGWPCEGVLPKEKLVKISPQN